MTSTMFEQDTDNLFTWDTIISYFDDAGDLTRRFINNDDGTTQDEGYDSGVLRSVVKTDFGTAENPDGTERWERIEEDYDADGNLTDTYRLDDNGIQTLGNYAEGVLRLKIETDFAPNGRPEDAAIWDTRWTYYDAAGVIESRTETRDDGLVIQTQYDNTGTRRYQEMSDRDTFGGPSDNRSWDRIETYYDETGQLSERFRTDDDGVTSVTGYDAGIRRFEFKDDRDDYGNSTDARSWDTIETFFDEAGLLSERIRIDDNGVTTYTSYDAGIRRFEAKTDLDEYGNGSDAKTWESIETFYDEAGTITDRFEVRDDGTTRYTSYDAGTRVSDSYNDRDDMGNKTDAKIWDSIEILYDANGKADERFETRDDGMKIYTDYDDGVRSFVEMLDRDEFGFSTDNRAWDTIRKYYDGDGDLDATETIYDNGDITAYFYEEGVKLGRFDVDGDNSHSWETREIVYNPDGTIADTIYNVDPFDNPS